MASQISQQYAYRAQKSLALIGPSPTYESVPGFIPPGPEVAARTYAYSVDGRLYAYALPTCVRIFQAEDASAPQQQHKNLRIFSVSTAEELVSFSQKSQDGWDVQYTITESHAIRLVGQEVQVWRPTQWKEGVVARLKVEGATKASVSPGLMNPAVAVFVGEKKGAPASIKVYALLSLSLSPTPPLPTCQKSFFKADRCTLKWNPLGTQLLLLTQTDVDNTNKSYYGETSLYVLSAAGNFDCRVTLDKEGPIHDFAWSPNSKEFGVVYGYMPAKAVLFDQRVRAVHDFGSGPQNYISFNPQGRLLVLAGFGNLAGKTDVYDRRTLSKLCTIDAPNTSHCEWSPDGRFLLTATLSPRLRVDNGIKIWYCTGQLVHVQLIEELYQVSWRPIPVDNVPSFHAQGPVGGLAPQPHSSVAEYYQNQKGGSATPGAGMDGTPVKPAGAYRPPGARGNATPAIFKREDEGGTPSGGNTPSRGYSRSPAPPGSASSGRGGRYVPGAPPPQKNGNETPSRPGSGSLGRQGSQGQEGQQGQGGRKRNKGGKNKDRENKGAGKEKEMEKQEEKKGKRGTDKDDNNSPKIKIPMRMERNPTTPGLTPIDTSTLTPVTPGLDSALDPIAKKVRNLNKKIKAIEELKEKAKRGERLEATQMKKIEGEVEIRKELAALGQSAPL
ncbi:eukaryotic translation initiation factor eIF2A-domain-containing protein [Lentinula raphanica]|nr:eukaryotic translation initiation factor eIF2A-domain-containing protein [Lentinula raphanica]